MKLAAFLTLSFVLAACGNSPTKTAADAEAAFRQYVTAINTGDIETAARMYDTAKAFHWVERGGIQYETGEQAAASLRQLSNTTGSSRMTINEFRVAGLGSGSALVSAQFNFGMLSPEGGEEFAFDGWMTVGMVKRADGWRIAGGQTGPGPSD